MTPLLEKAIAALSQLPESQQEDMARWILDELASDTAWEQSFAHSLPQLEQLAQKALDDYASGQVQELDPDQLP